MARGTVVTVAAGNGYAGKPRPAVILQDDRFDATDSVTIALFTTTEVEAPLFRLAVTPTPANGLTQPSWIMADKLVTVPRARIGKTVGRLSDEDMLRLNRALLVFLGLAG